MATPKQNSFTASIAKSFLPRKTYAMSSRQASGKRSRKAAPAVMVSRYFSRKIAQRTMRKYPLRSASLSAIGVAVSPGSRVMAAEAAVEAAVSSNTVSCFACREAMDRW